VGGSRPPLRSQLGGESVVVAAASSAWDARRESRGPAGGWLHSIGGMSTPPAIAATATGSNQVIANRESAGRNRVWI